MRKFIWNEIFLKERKRDEKLIEEWKIIWEKNIELQEKKNTEKVFVYTNSNELSVSI